ncbi:MAG TPA: LysR substrate-binding domain-containing protein, partial [Rhodanobacter sp.]|nr:LysR substrate-binding domain-containing protein [Rhodanobacter sp.]
GTGFDPARSQRTFRIIANDNAAMMLGPGLIARLREVPASGLRLAFLHPDARPVEERLEQGEADVALGFRAPAGGALVVRQLLADRFLVARRKRHSRERKPLDLDAYCAAGHVIVSSDGGGFASPVDRALAALGRKRRVALSVQDYTLAAALLATSDLLCTLPRRFLRRFAGSLATCEVPFELAGFQLAMSWHPRMRDDAGHAWLRRQLVAAAR